jgi:WD40 repeat protein
LPFSTAAAYSASFDGSVIVGTSGNAFRWTANVMQDLGHLPGATSAVAYKVSADGGVVVGYSGNLPFRWSQSTGMQELPVISGTIGAEARAVSADGSLIAGNISTDATGRAALWTATGVQLLSPLVGSQRSVDYGISPDGRFLVGLSGGSGNFATIWDTATNQTFDLRSFLIANGIDLTGWSLLEVAYSISGDNILGYNIVGGGVGPTGPAAFLVTGLHVVPEPSSLAFVGCLAGGLVGCRRRRRR